ncbi:putative nucleoporin (NUP54/57), partial [Trypanosoma theileri]
STGTGFAAAPAAPLGKAASGFGANTTGGFGANTTGGFGTNTTGTTGGFGANTTGTTGGFGTNTTGTTGGFGTNTTGTTGGFGANTTGTTGGFGANTTGTTGGFGANTTGTTGGFGANTTGTIGGFGGTSTGGFGGLGTTSAIGGQTQVPPYKGIKGPGFSTDWARSVNFSTLRDDVLFEDLPLPLQQHLLELHSFIQAEQDAKRFLESFLTDSLGSSGGDGSTSYRELLKKIAKLTVGENAVDAIRVDCFEREVSAQHLGQLLEKCEEEVTQYSKNVWEPLSDQDFTQRRLGNRSEPPSEPFQRCLRDIQVRMEDISAAVRELELAVLPDGQRQRRVTNTDGNTANTINTESSPSAALFSRYSVGPETLEVSSDLRCAVSSHPILQMNTTLSNELTTLLNLAAWTSRLHTRADAARDLFAHLYGASEAEVLLAQKHQQSPTGPKRPFSLHTKTSPSPFSDVEYKTIGDIHRRSIGLDPLGALGNGDRKMQYDVLLERQHQGSAPKTVSTTNVGFGDPKTSSGITAPGSAPVPAPAPAPSAAVAGTGGLLNAGATATATAGTGATATATATAAPAASMGFGLPASSTAGVGSGTTFGGLSNATGSGFSSNKKGRS